MDLLRHSTRLGVPAFVVLAALAAALASPVSAQTPPPPDDIPLPDDPPSYVYRIVCKSGKVVLETLPKLPEPHKTRNEASHRRHACPEEYDASGRPKVPLAPLPRIDDADLFRQTLGDIVGNTFRLRVTCPKACVVRSEVELVVADKRLLLYGAGPRHRLVAGRRTTIPIRFSASTRAKIRGAKFVRVNGFLDVSDSRGGKRTVTWRRTCRLGS